MSAEREAEAEACAAFADYLVGRYDEDHPFHVGARIALRILAARIRKGDHRATEKATA